MTLFTICDDDCSGLICWTEFKMVCRKILKIRRSILTDLDLAAVWCSIDYDRSGHVSAGEFGAFLKLGDSVHDASRAKKERERHDMIDAKVFQDAFTHPIDDASADALTKLETRPN